MATILFAWELGGNLGHFTMLLPIAQELRRLGHRVVFALGDLSVLAHCSDDFDFPVLQSPRWLPRFVGLDDALAFSDILPGAGFFSPDGLKVLVAAWHQLFQITRTDFVICEHAPTALLAARIENRRVLSIGTGFVCPPSRSELPRFSVLDRAQQLQLSAREKNMLKNCNAVIAKYNQKPLASLAELYNYTPALLCTYPELDHYDNRMVTDATTKYYGPIYGDVVSSSASWPRRYKNNVLVYLNNFFYWEPQLEALKSVQANILIVALGLSRKRMDNVLPDHINIVTAPIALRPVLDVADLVVCHGGHGTVANSLTAGKPVLIWPTQKEQGLMALRIAQQRLGTYSDLNQAPVRAITMQIEQLLRNAEIHQATQVFASKYRDNKVTTTVSNIAADISIILSAA